MPQDMSRSGFPRILAVTFVLSAGCARPQLMKFKRYMKEYINSSWNSINRIEHVENTKRSDKKYSLYNKDT